MKHPFYLICRPTHGQTPSLVPSSLPHILQTQSLHSSQAPSFAGAQAADPSKKWQQLSYLSADQTLKDQDTNPVNTATMLTPWHNACVISIKNTALCALRYPENKQKFNFSGHVQLNTEN